MINLSQLSRPKSNRPIIITLYGEGGMGKTTLAAMMPKPVLIPIEDGMKSIDDHPDILVFPRPETTKQVLEYIQALATQEHDRKTLIFDSVTQYEKIATKEIIESEPNPKCKSMAAAHGGFGKAFGLLDAKHQELREACDYLVTDVGMNIVFIAHAITEDLELPDLDKYSRYTIDLTNNKQCRAIHHYSNNVDMVGLVRLESFVRGSSDGGKKKAVSTGAREIICFPQAASNTKNRFGIDGPIPFTFEAGNPFENFAAK